MYVRAEIDVRRGNFESTAVTPAERATWWLPGMSNDITVNTDITIITRHGKTGSA